MDNRMLVPIYPGTQKARKRGCKCPYGLNHQAGVPGAWCDTSIWVVSTTCRLHWGGYQFTAED